MAFNYSPKIVTNGLVMYLDAANPRSYVSGSTVWNDVSRSGISGSLINGPIFNSASQGSIVFDGVDDYADSTNLSNIQTTSYWINTTTGSNINLSSCLGENIYINGTLLPSILGSELITNGNFAANTSGWTADSTMTWINSTSGDGSTGFMRFTINNNVNYDRFTQTISSVANQPYLISFWYQTSGITGNLAIFLNSNNITLANQIQGIAIEPSATWKYVSLLMRTTSTLGFPVFSFAKLGSIGAGNLDIDAISVRPIATGSFTPGQWVNITTTSAQPMYKSGYFAFTGQASGNTFGGRIANVMKYNRALTATEVAQNYNALKSRYGLT